MEDGHPKVIESRIYLTASMCGMNDYAYQASRSTSNIYNGFCVLEIENGRIVNDFYEEGTFTRALDLRTKEVWK